MRKSLPDPEEEKEVVKKKLIEIELRQKAKNKGTIKPKKETAGEKNATEETDKGRDEDRIEG